MTSMDNTPDSPAKTPEGYTTQGGNYWTLITPEIWKVLHAVLQTAIYLVVKEVFRRAAAALDASDPVGAATLRRASTHWLRHTSATHQADAGNDIRFIQKNLRHASIETTAIYLHAEDDQRHAATTGKGVLQGEGKS